MQNTSQEPQASSKDPNEDLKDMDVLCTFKIKIERQHFDHGCIKGQWSYKNQDWVQNPNQEPPASSNAQDEDLNDMDVLCTFIIKI